MIRIRLNGRGGQGGKTMAELMATMYFGGGNEAGKYRYVSSAPTFGPERRGSPVDAFIRLSQEPIRELGPFANPDMVIVLDESLTRVTDVTAGLNEGGLLLINSSQSPEAFADYAKRFRVATIDADAIAISHELGTSATPIVNTTLLGAFVRVSGLGVTLDALLGFIDTEITKKTDENKKAAHEAFHAVVVRKEE